MGPERSDCEQHRTVSTATNDSMARSLNGSILEGSYVGGVYFDGDGLADQVDLEHETKPPFLLDEYSDDSFKRTRNDFHAASDPQIRVGINGNAGFKEPSNCKNLVLWNRFRMAFMTDEANRPGHIQNTISVFRSIDLVHKNITRKERYPNPFLPVLPAAKDLPHGKKDFD